MTSLRANRLREQVHLLPMLIHNPITYENVHDTVARVLRIRGESPCGLPIRSDSEDQGLLRGEQGTSGCLHEGWLRSRTRRDNRSLCSAQLWSVWLGSQGSNSRSRLRSRRFGRSVVGPVPSAAAAPRWLWNLVGVCRTDACASRPWSRLARLVPESARVQVHEHAYMQITPRGSQGQTETSAFPFPQARREPGRRALQAGKHVRMRAPPSALLLLNSFSMGSKPTTYRFRLLDRSVYNLDVNAMSASTALQAAGDFYRLFRGREIVLEGLGIRAELDDRTIRIAQRRENKPGSSKRRPVARTSHFRAKMLRDGAESGVGRTKRASSRRGEANVV